MHYESLCQFEPIESGSANQITQYYWLIQHIRF